MNQKISVLSAPLTTPTIGVFNQMMYSIIKTVFIVY